jgi:hypothetical protein
MDLVVPTPPRMLTKVTAGGPPPPLPGENPEGER